MRTRLLFCSLILSGAVLSIVACGKKPPPKEPTITETVSDAGVDAADAEPPAPKPLFERLGGKEGITKVVDSFLASVLKNDVIKKRYAKLSKEKMEKLRNNLIAQICKESGGDCEYTGKSMKDAHKGMKITEPEWNATVSSLKSALDENQVPDDAQNDLIAAIAPMKDDIVEIKAKPKK